MFGRFTKGQMDVRVETPVEAEPVVSVSHDLRDEIAGDPFLHLKVELHRHLIDRFNLAVLETATRDEILNEIRPIVREFVRTASVALNARELDQLTTDTADEMLGLGPIEPLLKDD